MQGYLAYGFIASAGSITKSASLCSSFISGQDWFISEPFYVSTYATFKQVVSNQNHFFIFYISVLTTVPDYRQVILDYPTIREPMYPSWVPRNTRPVCSPGTNKTNPFHSCQGVQVPVQTWTPSPQLLRPSLSMVLRPALNTHP